LIERLDVRAPPIFINPNLWNFEPCAKNGAGSVRFVGSCAPLRYQNIALAGQTLGKRLGTEQRGNQRGERWRRHDLDFGPGRAGRPNTKQTTV
jgi:hypothetical protein